MYFFTKIKKILQKNNKKRRILYKNVELYKYSFHKDYEVNLILMKSKRKFIRNIILILAIIYVVFTLIKQQQTLNQYAKNSEDLSNQIEEQQNYKEELAKKLSDIDSEEYIEETAREKLDMYLPNEKVYIDTGM